MVNNPLLYAAIMTLACSTSILLNYFKCLWNCECYVCCAASSLFTYFGPFGSHVITHWAQWIPRYKMWITVSVRILGGTDTRASGIRGSFPHLLKYQDFCSINSVLTFRHRASCILGQAFHYSPEKAFYIFNQQIYFIIWDLLDRASLI